MMPMEPAKAVMMVRPFLVIRLFADSASAVEKAHRGLADGLARGVHLLFRGEVGIGIRADDAVGEDVHRARGVLGRQLRVVVTMMTRRSCGDLREQVHDLHRGMGVRAPVGSSASTISGSLMSARAMATRIWPPESWLGLFKCSGQPTDARPPWRGGCARPSPRPSVSASSTFCRMVWCGMRL